MFWLMLFGFSVVFATQGYILLKIRKLKLSSQLDESLKKQATHD